MILRYKDWKKCLAFVLADPQSIKGGVTLIRHKSDDESPEMLIEKTSGAKHVGLPVLVAFLCGFAADSTEALSVNWLLTEATFDSAEQLSRCIKIKDLHPLMESLVFACLRESDTTCVSEVQTWIKQFRQSHEETINSFIGKHQVPEVAEMDEKKVESALATAAPKKEERKAKDKKKEEVTDDYKQKVLSLKLQRLTKGQPVLPQEGANNILVTSALPYVNNLPHLGNLIGAVLSADVFARYSRLRGNRTLYICGTDMYGSASEIKGIQEGKPPGEVAEYYHQKHEEIYANFEIDFDYFGKTATPKHTEIVQDVFNKDSQNGFFTKKTTDEYFSKKYNIGLADRFITGTCPHCGYESANGDQCDKCGKLLDPQNLVNPKCALSGEPPERRPTHHHYLDLTSLESEVRKFIEKTSVEGKWSANSIAISEAWLKTGLKPRSMTRDLNWGVPVPGESAKVFYVWFDAPIGYISITANYTDSWKLWWQNPEQVRLFQFMGKDNVPFHTVMFPASLIGTRDDWTMLHHISTTEYLNYENGKFSKSKNRGVFGDHVKELPYLISCWRYYLLVNRPENSDSQFQWGDFQTKINDELLPNPGNLVNRVLALAYHNYDKKVPECTPEDLLKYENVNIRSDHEFLEKVLQRVHSYTHQMDYAKLKDGLKSVMELSSLCNKFMTDNWTQKIDAHRKQVIVAILANVIRVVGCLFEPFMPSFSAMIYFFLGMERSLADETFIESLLKSKPLDLVSLVPGGQPMNQPIPIFSVIPDDEIIKHKETFTPKDVDAGADH